MCLQLCPCVTKYVTVWPFMQHYFTLSYKLSKYIPLCNILVFLCQPCSFVYLCEKEFYCVLLEGSDKVPFPLPVKTILAAVCSGMRHQPWRGQPAEGAASVARAIRAIGPEEQCFNVITLYHCFKPYRNNMHLTHLVLIWLVTDQERLESDLVQH